MTTVPYDTHPEISVTDTTPLMLRRAQEMPLVDVVATARHDNTSYQDVPTERVTGGYGPNTRPDPDRETVRD